MPSDCSDSWNLGSINDAGLGRGAGHALQSRAMGMHGKTGEGPQSYSIPRISILGLQGPRKGPTQEGP